MRSQRSTRRVSNSRSASTGASTRTTSPCATRSSSGESASSPRPHHRAATRSRPRGRIDARRAASSWTPPSTTSTWPATVPAARWRRFSPAAASGSIPDGDLGDLATAVVTLVHETARSADRQQPPGGLRLRPACRGVRIRRDGEARQPVGAQRCPRTADGARSARLPFFFLERSSRATSASGRRSARGARRRALAGERRRRTRRWCSASRRSGRHARGGGCAWTRSPCSRAGCRHWCCRVRRVEHRHGRGRPRTRGRPPGAISSAPAGPAVHVRDRRPPRRADRAPDGPRGRPGGRRPHRDPQRLPEPVRRPRPRVALVVSSTQTLADAANEAGALLVYVSTD